MKEMKKLMPCKIEGKQSLTIFWGEKIVKMTSSSLLQHFDDFLEKNRENEKTSKLQYFDDFLGKNRKYFCIANFFRKRKSRKKDFSWDQKIVKIN